MPEYLYRIQSLNYKYPASEKQFNLQINEMKLETGKIHCFAGHNGSGKTTLLKILNGLLKVQDNTVFYQNRCLNAVKQDKIRKDTVFVHQFPYLFEGTVLSNLNLVLKYASSEKTRNHESVSRIIEQFNLAPLAHKNASSLSDGERKRTAIARAALIDTPVLLLDEPFANLDSASSTLLKEFLLEQIAAQRKTIIMSSHDLNILNGQATVYYHLEDGRLK